MSKVTVIYHANCLDGLFAARATYHGLLDAYSYSDITFVAASYGDAPPDVTGQLVYIVDFSYSRDVLLALGDRAKRIVVLDHHKTAWKELGGIQHPNIRVHFDMEKSGCVLARLWFTPHDLAFPPVLKYVQDRDLWRFDYPETKAVCAALYLEGFDDPRGPLVYAIDDLVSQGLAVLKYQEKLLDKLTAPENVRCYNFRGHTNVAFVNSPVLQSEIGDRLSLKHPFVVIHYMDNEKQIFSLRSNKNNPDWVDVAEIAEGYGGGGHVNAAGFTLPLEAYLAEIN